MPSTRTRIVPCADALSTSPRRPVVSANARPPIRLAAEPANHPHSLANEEEEAEQKRNNKLNVSASCCKTARKGILNSRRFKNAVSKTDPTPTPYCWAAEPAARAPSWEARISLGKPGHPTGPRSGRRKKLRKSASFAYKG